ncbi:MAG TPA: apolipoprotein N-acyltransferase [Candidatus Polarisedimenticolaceae bacterium]
MRRDASFVLAATAAGGLAGLCWLPLGLAPLFPVAMLLAMRGLRRVRTPRGAVAFGLAFGAARYVVAAHFLLALLSYSPLAIAIYALAIVFILPFGVLECWGAFVLERRLRIPRGVGFGALYVLGGWLRTLGDLSFPADRLAHAFGTDPAWLAASPWIGPTGLEVLVFASAALLDRAIETRGSRPRAAVWASSALAVWLSPVLLDAVGPSVPAPHPLRVGVVQPAVELADKMRKDRWPALWARLEGLTVDAARDADLVVWPETARPSPLLWDGAAAFRDPEMEALARRVGVPILYGCEIARRDAGVVTALYNGAAIAYPDGRPAVWYGKQHLLPFVEGVPFVRAFGWDPHRRTAGERRSLLTLLGPFTPGPPPPLFEVGGARIGVLICFEGMYDALARRYRDAGADLLVVLTNDAWWDGSVFPEWHARMVAARARETHLPVVRAANNGISAAIDPAGRLRNSTRWGEATAMRPTDAADRSPTSLARR